MEQMTIILRFVDKYDFIRERFFHIVHVKDTIALTLKKRYVMSFLVTTLKFRIFEVRDMMEVVICVVNEMGYKLYFLENVPMCIALLISYN